MNERRNQAHKVLMKEMRMIEELLNSKKTSLLTE